MALLHTDPTLEHEQLSHLQSHGVLSPQTEEVLAQIARLAASLTGTPAAMLSLVSKGRVWFKSWHGIEQDHVEQVPDLGACAMTGDAACVVENALEDARCGRHPLVQGPPGVRFYAAVPLRGRDGEGRACRLGVLAVLDFKPRTLDAGKNGAMEHLAALAVSRLEEHCRAEPQASPASDRVERGGVQEGSAPARVRAVRPTVTETLERVERVACIGSWSWDILADEALWSAMLYDMFLRDRSLPAPKFEELRPLFTPESFARFSAAAQRCVGEGVGYSLDLEGIRTDGTRFFVQLRGQAVRDGGGRIASVYGTAQDITELKRAEQTLRESEARWQLAVESLRGGMWEWNAVTGAAYYSPQWKAMLGYSDVEIPPTLDAWRSLVHPDDLPLCLDSLEKYRAATAGPHRCEAYRLRARDGAWRWIESTGLVVERGADGQIGKVIGMHVDVTSRKEVEDRIRMLHERLSLAIKAGHVGIWEVDLVTGQFLFNEQMHEIYGLADGGFRDGVPPNTFGGHVSQWHALMHPEDRGSVVSSMQRAVVDGGIIEFEHRILRPSGEVRRVKSAAHVLRDAAGTAQRKIGTTLDVTEQWHLTDTLARDRERVLLATQASSIGIWEFDFEEGRFLWDEKMHALYDLEPGEFDLTMEGWRRLIHPGDVRRVEAAWVKFRGGGTFFESEFRIFHKSGDVRHIRSLAQVFPGADGTLPRMLGTNWDVTSEKSTANPGSRKAAPVPSPVGSLTARKLALVLTYVDQHLGEPVTLEMIAHVAGISPSHFSELFRQCMGQAPHQYLMARRIDRARDLLCKTDLSIAEVAMSVGLADQSHLTRLMRRFTGLTPRMLRSAKESGPELTPLVRSKNP